MNVPDIILASRSPRRKELLSRMGLDFRVIASDFSEQLDASRPASEVAVELALGKALVVARLYPDSIVIGSDTIVSLDGRQLEKPRDVADAYRILKLLSGKENQVTTALAVVRLSDNIQLTGVDEARVLFKAYDEPAVRVYIATGDPMDKAGAYGIQSGAAPLIEHFQGNFDAIVGLPTKLLSEFLANFGVPSQSVALEAPVQKLTV